MVRVFVILDGIGDRSCKALNGLTPLESASTKNLDYFSGKGNGGYVYAINEKIAPESDEAIMALLGYDPTKYYYGRGPLAAFGSGMEFSDGYLALRTNFATLEGNKIIDRRAGRTLTTSEAKALEKSINEKVSLDYPFKFKATVGHRGVLVIKGDFSANISNIDPAYKKVGKFGIAVSTRLNEVEECKALDPEKKTKLSANAVNSFFRQTREILKYHEVNHRRNKKYLLEANALLLRDAGTILPELPKKTEWAAVVSMPLEVGISKLAGMKVLKFDYPETTNHGFSYNLYEGVKETISESIKAISSGKYKNYLIHFKETDVFGHENMAIEKKKIIEIIDKEFFGFLRKIEDLELAVTGDHSTPCEMRGHTSDFVPLLHFNAKLEKNDTMQRFNESECADGYYGKMYGKDVLKTLKFL